jgi:diguanylate cyclase (GGDEF)-like protein/hemerythrin-like metal-binding protein
MESFVWSDIYETEVPLVDKEHRKLVDLINQFGSLLAQNQVETSDIQDVLKELLDYAEYHFRNEEGLMRESKISARHFDQHVISHNDFLVEVKMLYQAFSSKNRESASQLLEFLIHWLVYHILGIDRNMAKQLKKIQSGATPEQAYESEEKERDKSTEPLVAALNGLFHQVSLRNKELIQLNLSLEEKVAQRTQELLDINRYLEELSLTDTLTNLPNRRHAIHSLKLLWEESKIEEQPLVCMMIDADHFKEVNDTYGHDAGDVVLVELANTLRDCFRSDDIVCRLGGDEFMVICPDTDQAGGLFIAEQARQKVSELRVVTGGEPWQGSISVGVAARTPEMDSFDSLMKKADDGVYAAKRDGKNCVRSSA